MPSKSLKQHRMMQAEDKFQKEDTNESKMSKLHASIGDHLDKHIAAYKSGKMDADTLGQHSFNTHAKIAKKHGLSHIHAMKFVNDYVDSHLDESLSEIGFSEKKFTSFKTYLSEASIVASSSSSEGLRHKAKYIDPYIGSKTSTHTVNKVHGSILPGASVKIRKVEDIGGKHHAHVTDEAGNKEVIPVSKLNKPGTKSENEGHKFESAFAEKLKKHGLMDKDAQGAGSTAGTDFHVNDADKAKKHAGKVHSATKLNGETKLDTTAAMGQLTINHGHNPTTGKKEWHISDEARAKRPEYAKEIEDAGILHHMNKHHKNPDKEETTASGRAKNVTIDHPNLDPGKAYLRDHHVDILHVGSHGTYGISDKSKRVGLPELSGRGKWTIREKQAGNKRARTVMFQPHGKGGLDSSSVNLENDEHINHLKKKLGYT